MRQQIAIACPELPLPVIDPTAGTPAAIRNFSISTRLKPTEVIGHLHRNYPPPSISHTFLQLLKHASDSAENPGKSPVVALLGEMGTGKTSAAELAFYLVDGIPPEIFDCGDRSLDELLFEPIIPDNSNSLLSRLEAKFNSGQINPLNRNLIEKEIGEAVQEEDGQTKLDFSLISPERLSKAIEVVNTCLRLEGISPTTGLEITYKEGPLIRLWKEAQKAEKEGKPFSARLIVDEIDKRLPNSGKSLQQVWLVLQGLRESHTVNKNGREFTFSRKDMPKGFSVVITGNDARDLGMSGDQSGLSQSQASRMTILTIDKPTKEDLVHRILQFLTGTSFAATTLLPENPKAHGKLLHSIRTLGTKEPLTEEEKWCLENPDKTLKAAQQLANFYHKWGEMTGPDNTINDPILEAAAAFREPPGVRMAHSHTLRAKAGDLLQADFEPTAPAENPLENLLNQPPSSNKSEQNLGERLSLVILEAIQKSAGTPATKGRILDLARTEGITTEDDEENNPNPRRKILAHLLDTNVKEYQISPETRHLQEALYQQILKDHSEKFQGKVPAMENLLPAFEVQSALDQMRDKTTQNTTKATTFILDINPKYLDGDKNEKPIECIPVLFANCETHYKKLKEHAGAKTLRPNMVPTEDFLALIRTPNIGREILDNLWNEGWKKEIRRDLEENGVILPTDDLPECTRMITGEADLKIAKIFTYGKEKPNGTLLFYHPQQKSLWALGDGFTTHEDIAVEGLTIRTYPSHETQVLRNSLVTSLGGTQASEFEKNLNQALNSFHEEEVESTTPTTTHLEIAAKTSRMANAKIPLRLSKEEIAEIR